MFPYLAKRGVDLACELVALLPAAHTSLGGIAVDRRRESSVGGLFAVGECLYTALYEGRESAQRNALNKVHMSADEWRRSWPAWLRGTALGFPFGTIPAGGTEIPTFLSYGVERKLSRHPEQFGTTGAIEGVAGPEAANNAAVTATLVPLLTLGIPTSVTAAILLSAR